jgi:hypothetical protein
MTSDLEQLVAKWRDDAGQVIDIYGNGMRRCADELEAALRQQASAPGQAFRVTEDDARWVYNRANELQASKPIGTLLYGSLAQAIEERLAARPSAPAPRGAVEVPTLDELRRAARLSGISIPDKLHLWLERVIEKRERPAPSAPGAQAWTREMAERFLCDNAGILPMQASRKSVDAIYATGLKLFGSTAPVASAQAWTRELARSMAEDFDRRNESHDEPDNDTWAEDMFCAGIKAFGMRCPTTAPVASAQGGDLDAPAGCGKAPMQCISCDDFRLAIDESRSETYRYKTALEQEKQEHIGAAERLESAERDLAAERAAHEATKADLRGALAIVKEDRQKWFDLAVHRQDEVDAAEKRAAELERELAKVREESVGKRLLEVTVRERNDARAELAACKAKLEGLREACALSEAEASYLSTYVSCDHDSPVAVIKRIQSALQATQAEKLARLPEPGESVAFDVEFRRDGSRKLTPKLPEPDTLSTLGDVDEPTVGLSSDAKLPASFFAPEPGTVLNGKDAKAFMLANPGRVVETGAYRYRRSPTRRAFEVKSGSAEWSDCTDMNHDGYEFPYRYTVLPPEPASAEKPSLEERVGHHEQALRHILDAMGKLTTEHGDSVMTVYGDTSLADAREALDGAGKAEVE